MNYGNPQTRHPLYCICLCLLLLATASPGLAGQSTSDDEGAVRNLVVAMNRAVTDRDLEAILATFAPGAVKVDLYRAHVFGGGEDQPFEPGEVSDLAARWQTVAAILFNSTRLYERKVSSIDIHVDGGMAVAWAVIDTRSQSRVEGAPIKANRYTEVYLAREIDGAWKIVATSNNRSDANARIEN